MKKRRLLPTLMLSSWLLASMGTPLAAQSLLCVPREGKVEIVRKVHRGRPYVLVDGKLTPVITDRCGLVPAKEFLPVFISVRKLAVKTSYVTLTGAAAGADINHDFHLTASFETPYELHDTFLVLELNTSKTGKVLFYYEIGEIGPDHPRWVEVHAPLQSPLGEGNYQLHLFSEGMEVLHSEQPWQFREGVLDEMVRKRIEGVTEGMPRPLFGPAPEYPDSLLKEGVKGEVLVKFRIAPNGAVQEPVVEKATHPALAEKALAAVRLWRFLPRIKDGNAVATDVTLPFSFSPPAGKK